MERKRPPVKTDGRENIYVRKMVFKKPPADQGHLNPKQMARLCLLLQM